MADDERDDKAVIETGDGDVKRAAVRAKPTKTLPTSRIAYTKQVDIIRAFGTAYVTQNRAVTPTDVGALVEMAPSTISLATPFFVDVGLLSRSESGFIPHADVIAFHRAAEWRAENPASKLQHMLRATWFAQALTARLSFRGMMEEGEALTILADAASATTEYRSQLALLLYFLEVAGIIEREGSTIRAVPAAQSHPGVPPAPPAPPQPPSTTENRPAAAAMRTITFPSGGSLTVSGNFNPFELEGPERELVYKIIDLMIVFERPKEGGS